MRWMKIYFSMMMDGLLSIIDKEQNNKNEGINFFKTVIFLITLFSSNWFKEIINKENFCFIIKL